MAIKNGNLTDADNVVEEIIDRNASGILFNCITNDIAGFYNGTTEISESDFEENGFFWSTSASDKDDTTNSTALLSTTESPEQYYGGTVVDEFDDASIDTTIWQVLDSPVTETGGYLLIGGSGINGDISEVVADGSSATDYKTLSADSELIFTQDGNGGTGSNGTNIWGISNDNGTSPVTLLTENGNPDGVDSTVVRIQIDDSLSQARAIADGVVGSWQDISGLSQWRLYIKHTNSSSVGGTPGLRVKTYRHLIGGGGTKIYQSSITTLNTTVTGATVHIPTSFDVAESSSTTYKLTANNGANWETVTPGTFHRFTNTGTQLGLQITMTENTSSLDVTAGTNNSILPHFSGIWGIRWSDNG